MIITKNTTFEELNLLQNGDVVKITKDVALNKGLLEHIVALCPDSKISILSGYDSQQSYSEQDPFFDRDELLVLIENVKQLKEKLKTEITFDDDISIEQAVVANRKFNNMASEIENAKLDGQELSDYEKFLWAYQMVTEKVYTLENEGDDPSKSRNLFEVLTGDKIVCVGYANMLVALCKRLGIKCTHQTVSTIDPKTNAYGNHATVAIRIDDDKYGIHGVFFCDPTADSALVKRNGYGYTSFNHSLIPFSKINKFYKDPVVLDKSVSTSFLVRYTTPEEVEKMGSNVPKILSFLFPEISEGKTQNIIIEKRAKETISKSKIKDDIFSFVDGFDDGKIENSLNLVLQSYAKMTIENNQPLEQFLIRVTRLGYSKDEAFKIVKDLCSKENVANSLSQKYKMYPEPLKTNQIEKGLKNFENLFARFEKSVETIAVPENKTSAESLFEQLALKITSICTAKHFFDTDKKQTFVEFAQLMKMGYTKEQINQKLKELCTDENLLVASFLTEHPDNLKRKAETNEEELYMVFRSNDESSTYIFNEPYEETFEKECAKAKIVSIETMQKALFNVFKSQGNDDEMAKNLALLSLRRTATEIQMQ